VLTTGLGVTETVIGYTALAQLPVLVDVATTLYTKLPTALPALVSVWAIGVPEEAVPPVIPPVFVPNVQLKVLAELALNAMLVVLPLQIEAVVGVDADTLGTVGSAVIVCDFKESLQPVLVYFT